MVLNSSVGTELFYHGLCDTASLVIQTLHYIDTELRMIFAIETTDRICPQTVTVINRRWMAEE